MSGFFCMAMTCSRQPSICHDSEGRHHKVMGAVLVLEVVKKKTEQTLQSVIETCRHRLRAYDRLMES